MTRKTGIYTHDGVSMPYSIQGKGEPLLFLTGAWVDPSIFTPLLAKLAINYQVIAPHIPPFGTSSAPDLGWTFIDYGKFFASFLRFLECRKPVVVGHSFGACIGLCIALCYPITKLVLMSPPAKPYEVRGIYRTYSGIVARALFAMARAGNTRVAGQIVYSVARVVRSKKNPASLLELVTNCLTSMTPVFSQNTPTVILWAKNDENLPTAVGNWLHKKITNSKIIFVEGHHNWCIVDQEAAFAYIKKAL